MPAIIYRNASGDRVPSVTTILKNLGWNTDALMYWAYSQGVDGKDFRETQQRAADVGTLAHAMLEAHICGRDFAWDGDDEELLRKAGYAFGAYREWEENSKALVVASELRVVSEEHQFGGGPDGLMVTKRGLGLPDWKSGAGIYTEHVVQVAAYTFAVEEVIGERLDGGAHLFRFDKESGGFLHRWLPREALGAPWRVFLRLREIHDQKKALTALSR